MECAINVTKYTTKVNAQRVYIVLVGLDRVRGQVLATRPLTNIQSVYVVVCAEANRQGAMLRGTTGQGVAMITKRNSSLKKEP